MNEIRVRFFCDNNDEYTEIWKMVGKERYYARYYAYGGVWYSVYDAPYGYCELGAPIRDDIVFIVCDDNGKECFRSSNGDGTSNFKNLPTNSQRYPEFIQAFPNVKIDGRRLWIRQFLTPDIREQLKNEPCIDDNFVDAWIETVKENVVGTFSWNGQNVLVHQIMKVSRYNSTARWYLYWGEIEPTGRGDYIGWEPATDPMS